MSKIYSFDDNLDFSQKNQRDPRWNQAYHEFFPGLSHIEFVSESKYQDGGVDKIIYMKDGKQYNIDEKVDKKGYIRFPIEIIQDSITGRPGWAVKEGQMTDYIAYLVRPKQDYYLISYKELTGALRKNYQRWLDDAHNSRNGFLYRVVKNDKEGGVVWHTHNICVPLRFLMKYFPSIQHWKTVVYQSDLLGNDDA